MAVKKTSYYISYGELCVAILKKYNSLGEFSKKVLNLPLKEFERILKCERELTLGQIEKMIDALEPPSYSINDLFFNMFEIK